MELVYIVKPIHSNVYKIGKTVNLEKRMKRMSKKYNFEIVLVYSHNVSNAFEVEHWAQARFSQYHLGGDWFAFDENTLSDMISFIEGFK